MEPCVFLIILKIGGSLPGIRTAMYALYLDK